MSFCIFGAYFDADPKRDYHDIELFPPSDLSICHGDDCYYVGIEPFKNKKSMEKFRNMTINQILEEAKIQLKNIGIQQDVSIHVVGVL